MFHLLEGVFAFTRSDLQAPLLFQLFVVGTPLLIGIGGGSLLLYSRRASGASSTHLALLGLGVAAASLLAVPVFAMIVAFVTIMFFAFTAVG